MTKAERAALEDAEIRAAFHRTPAVLPDLMPPWLGGQPTIGWAANWNGTLVQEWVSSPSTEETVDGGRRGGSRQWATPLYSTEVLALRAMRNHEEMRAAVALRRIDIAIAKAGG